MDDTQTNPSPSEEKETASPSEKKGTTSAADRNRKNIRKKRRIAKKQLAKANRPQPQPIVVGEVATAAKVRPRHWGVILSFLFLCVLPVALVGFYLYFKAVDQYASTVGFSVRTEDTSSSIDVLGALTGTSSNGSKDTDILYEFIQSKDLVNSIDESLDLRSIWSWPENDPVFVFNPEGTIEDLHSYWAKMIRIDYEASTGLIELNALAFRPEDAKKIAVAIFEESSTMINDLSAIARADSTQYARDELDLSEKRLRKARLAVAQFREQTQVIDPSAVIQGQNGILNSLQTQLAETIIELDLLRQTARNNDPRILQAERKVGVIEKRIENEREKFSNSIEADGKGFSTLVSEYENLTVEREFAEQAYLASLSAYDGTLSEARRQSRYLAPHARPSLAQRSEFPKRETILGLVAFFNLLIWTIGVLIYYTIRDRR